MLSKTCNGTVYFETDATLVTMTVCSMVWILPTLLPHVMLAPAAVISLNSTLGCFEPDVVKPRVGVVNTIYELVESR